MRKFRLSGRELAVLRAIDFSLGTPGAEIMSRTNIDPVELADILNSLMETGFIETTPASEHVKIKDLEETMFDVNPSYAMTLRDAIKRH